MKPEKSVERQRRELVEKMLDPNLDLAGVRRVRQEVQEWLKLHPDDPRF
jgi:hypothetical protein